MVDFSFMVCRQSGYKCKNKWAERAFDLSIALFFLVPALVLMAVLYVILILFDNDGGPFFYKGERLGKGKIPFNIYKIRTLSMNAEARLGSDLLTAGSHLERKFGRFIRWTRLDELPQLLNIIKGDMSFLGPRPVRLAVYNRVQADIPNYDNRFRVKPGLLGYAQLLTPHSTPKKMRARIDNKYVKMNRHLCGEIGLAGRTLVILARNLIMETYLTTLDRIDVWRSGRDKDIERKARRMRVKDVRTFIADEAFNKKTHMVCKLIDINAEALSLTFKTSIGLEQDAKIHLVMEVPKNGKTVRVKLAADVYYKKENQSGDRNSTIFVAFYEPITELGRYMVDQYVLKQSIAYF